MISAILPLAELKAAAIFASNDSTRYILNGVYVQVDQYGQITLAATDGRRACLIRSDGVVSVAGEVAAFILPLRLIARATPVRKTGNIELRAEAVTAGQELGGTQSANTRYTLTLSDGETGVSGKSVDGKYPKYAQVLPAAVVAANTRLMMQPKFVADLAAVSRLLRPKNSKILPAVIMGGESETKAITILLSGVPKFYSIVMPVRVEELEFSGFGAPTWTKTDVFAPAHATDAAATKEAA